MRKSYFPNLVPRVFSYSWVGESPACKAAICTPVSPTFWTSIVDDTCTISLKKNRNLSLRDLQTKIFLYLPRDNVLNEVLYLCAHLGNCCSKERATIN